MMKSLTEQISDRCIHFNGVMNDCCEVGIAYKDVRVDRPFKFPCLKQGGECVRCQFPTESEVSKEIKDIQKMGVKSLTAFMKVKEQIALSQELTGKVSCECGGEMQYQVAQINGHIWAKCSKCGISFNE